MADVGYGGFAFGLDPPWLRTNPYFLRIEAREPDADALCVVWISTLRLP
jgi:hypothetical protein